MSRIPLPHRQRLFGWWLAVLAICALNLQSLQHYQPGMLLNADICSTSSDGQPSADPEGKTSSHAGVCSLCCSWSGPAFISVAAVAPMPLVRAVEVLVATSSAAPALSRFWSASRPRGPPAPV